ncbi:imelysin family protein [Paraglaciecola sp. 2405UD69-4]|uniref:imelysin family protein n=1 Tax=Paraglaciecola sp. 2405UD69-4 TaxID=3391836 RepID=UPI0039C92416
MKKSSISLALLLALSLTACIDDGEDGVAGADGATGADGTDGVSVYVTRDDVVTSNANIAYAAYADSLISAQSLRDSLTTFVADPSETNFVAAKQAWLDAREPYGQTEVYRFRVGPIDALTTDENGDYVLGEEGDGPEGRINAWPLGEALIDYVAAEVDGDEGEGLAGSSIIEDTDSYPNITEDVISSLFEYEGEEANVTTGYHAIEFLLWGQDLNADLSGSGDRDATAGQRTVSDYSIVSGECTSGTEIVADEICVRRGEYLLAAAEILIDDLTTVVEAWEPETGFHYENFVAGGDDSLALIFEGMGRLSFGELAGERINIALTTDSQEDEHSCFSDNTHRDIFLNAKGVQNAFNASYTRIDGEVVEGASPYDLLVVEGEFELANNLRSALEATMSAASVIDTKAKTGTPFDVLIQEGISQENVVAVIQALDTQTGYIEDSIDALSITTGDLYQDTEEEF